MSTEPKNKWRLLHELVLKVKNAQDFETLGAVVEELAELKTAEGNAAKFGNGQYFAAVSNAYIVAWKKLGQWQENPPPIAPQETQIGPGNPFPVPPPPPPPTVAGEEFISLEFLLHLAKEAKRGSGDCFALWLPRLCVELNRWASANAKPPTPQAPGSLDALKEKIRVEIVKCFDENTPKHNGLLEYVEKAFDEHAAQNAKAIERAAEPVKTPEPWTGESFYAAYALAHERPCGWADLSAEGQSEWNRIAGIANERMGIAPSPLKPWTAEEFYLQFGQPLGRVGIVTSVRLGAAQREACEKAAAVINKWAGLAS